MHDHHRPRPAPRSARPADLQIPTADPRTRLADPRVRIGDAERDRVIDQLADHHAAGRLTLAEFEDRMAAASTARTGADLAMLTADLPAPPAPPVDRSPARPTARGLRLDPAVRTYLAVMALLWLIWLVTAVAAGAYYPWPIWPMLGWGVGVAGRHRRDPARPVP
jgi:Domain of unknown function (DUF1707)/2TM domain